METDQTKLTPYNTKMMELIEQLRPQTCNHIRTHDLNNIQQIDLPQGSGSFRSYIASKVKRIGIGSFSGDNLYQLGFCSIFPEENYDVPVFFSKWIESRTEITFLVDLLPTVDSLIDEEYSKKYFVSLQPLWERFANLPGISPEEDDTMRSLCSIIYTAANIPIEKNGMRLAALAPHIEYLKAHINFCREAQEIGDQKRQRTIKQKRKAICQTLSRHIRAILNEKTMGITLPQDTLHSIITIISGE